MAKTEITGMRNTPLVNLIDNVGSTFTGVIIAASREVKTKQGSTKYAYAFKVVDGDVDFVKKNGEAYEKVEVAEGDEVTVLATKPLHMKLSQLPVGSTVEIEYRGKKRMKTGGQFHDFGVFNVEAE